MTDQTIAQAVLTNALLAAVLAALVASFSRRLAHPWMVRAAWLVILLRLLVPPVIPLRLSVPAQRAVNGVVEAAAEAFMAVPEPEATRSGASPNPWFLFWLTGALAVASLSGRQALRLAGLVRRGRPAPPDLTALVARRARELGIPVPRTLVVENGRCPPAVLALPGRRLLLLPGALLTLLRSEEIEALITHELTHLRRRDHWVRLLETATLLTYWWHPVAWWAVRQARHAEEQSCDDAVRRRFPELARPLARCLVQVALQAPTAVPLPASGFADIAHLERRIVMLTKGLLPRRPRLGEAAGLAVLVAAVVVTPVLMAAGTDPETVGEGGKATPHAAAAAADHPGTGQDKAEPPPTVMTFRGQPLLRVGEDSGITPPRKVHDVRPRYPVDARKEKVQGVVILNSVVDEEGRVAEVHVVREAPMGLTEAAVAAVRQWRYEPAVKDGVAVPVSFVTTINFRLDTSPPEPPGEWQGQPLHRIQPGGEVAEPRKVKDARPRYPEEVRRRGESGTVVMEVIIDTEGQVKAVRVVESPSEELAQAAAEAVRQWQYEPTVKDGKPVPVLLTVTVRFRLAQ